MPLNSRIHELLSRWEQGCQEGRDISPEELCHDQPELLAELWLKIQELKAVNQDLDLALTPDQAGTGQELATATSCPPARLSPLPLSGYDVLELLGQGGMGVVYKARDRQRNAVVALKTLPWQEPSALYRFKHEFRALADVVHPNLVTLYELIADGPQWFFTMELVEGTDLLTHVRAVADPGPRQRLRQVLRQLAEGVVALHRAGTLHRDIKPSNVLVTSEGRVVLLDFGLAAELGEAGQHQSTEQHLLGTIAYMSPEQAASLPLSPASDWYSVGVMFYEALTGRLPFAGSAVQILSAKQQSEPPAPREAAPDVPEDLDQLCVELLRLDPGARPDGAEVLRRLGSRPGTAPLPAPSRTRPALIGRQDHLRALADAFAAVKQGRPVAVALHGRSGIGKSTLLHGFLEDLEKQPDVVVLSGRCYEQESVPYKALDSLVDALSRYLGHLSALEVEALLPRDVLSLARVFPVLRRVKAVAAAERGREVQDAQEVRRRAFAALRELLARLGDRKSLVLSIDDLQWGDADSAALLVDLLRPPDAPAILLLGCYRREEAASGPCVQALQQLGNPEAGVHWRDLPLEALGAAEAEELAQNLLGEEGPVAREQVRAIARESGGSPFFICELAQHLRSNVGPAALAGGPRSVALDEVLWSRVMGLPEAARRLLEVAAVAGRPLPQTEALRAAGLRGEELAALGQLRSGRLIRSVGLAAGNEIETYHDRIRETVVAHLAPEVLRQHHQRLAEALEASGRADAEVLAVHCSGAGDLERASTYYTTAAVRAAETLAFDRAALLYRLALGLRKIDDAAGQRLQTGLADALANAGRGAEAGREYLAAAAGAAGTEALELQRRAALQYLIGGHVDEGIRTLGPVLKAVGMRLAPTPLRALLALLFRRAQLWLRGVGFREHTEYEVPARDLERIDICWSVSLGLIMVDSIRSASFLTRGVLLALRAGEPFRISRALALEAGLISTAGWWAKPRATKLARFARDLARRLGHPYALAMATFVEGAASSLEGSWKSGLEQCDQAERLFREQCVGVAWELDTTRTFSLWCLNFMGQVAELGRRWHEQVLEARKRGDLFALTNLRTFNMATVRLAADDPDRARGDVGEAIGQWSQEGYHVQHHMALLARVPIELYTGNAAAALEEVTKNASAFRKSLLGRIQSLRIHMLQMHAYSALAVAADAADPTPLLRVAGRAARRLRRERLPWPDALDRYIRATVAVRCGDTAGGCRLLAEAVAAFEKADMGLYGAATRRRLGELIGGTEGRDLVTRADAWMTGQGIRNPTRMAAAFAPGFPE
jgi:eukaryotic-like serine/threonine-protein kinase